MSEIDFANLLIDGQSLLLPRSDVRHIELVEKLQPPGPGEGGATILGTLDHEQRQWPVYTLDSALLPMQTLPLERRFIACLGPKGRVMALACESVSRFQLQGDFLLDELPLMMKTARTPLQSLLYNEGRLHYVTSAEALVGYLLKRGHRT